MSDEGTFAAGSFLSEKVRPARAGDSSAIAALLKGAADRGLILPRSEREVRQYIDSFLVALVQGEVVGCVALRDFGEGLFEVRSLVVDDRFAGCGLGSRLVRGMLEEAKRREGRQVFTLTYRSRLFQRLGFVRVDKSQFPQKVWSDCSICPKRDDCDETALLYQVR